MEGVVVALVASNALKNRAGVSDSTIPEHLLQNCALLSDVWCIEANRQFERMLTISYRLSVQSSNLL